MDENENRLDELVAAVLAGPRYRPISGEMVRRIAAQELEKGRSWKETIKATRNKLHQVGGAYQEAGIDTRAGCQNWTACRAPWRIHKCAIFAGG